MRWSRLAVTLSALNLVLLGAALVRAPRVAASDVAPVLRGRALELIDTHGRVRAEIKVLPADATVKMPDGRTGYPETVLLRLIDSNGAPNVKVAATDDGGGLVLGGDESYVQVLSRGGSPFVKIVDKTKAERVIAAR